MTLLVILWILALLADSLLYFGLNLQTDWIWFWVPILGAFLFFALAFVAWLLYLYIASLFIDKNKKRDHINLFAAWTVHETCYVLCFVLNVHIKTTGFEALPKDESFVVVSNHLSNFDQICMLAKLPTKRVICISKPENFKIPIAGAWVAFAGYMPINRTDVREGVRVINEAVASLKDGTSVYINPEGTRAKDHLLHPFHRGTFHLATDSGRPLYAVCIQDTWKIMHSPLIVPHTVRLDLVYSCLKTEGAHANELCDAAYSAIAERLGKDRVGGPYDHELPTF